MTFKYLYIERIILWPGATETKKYIILKAISL